jgi:hypothetical protein
VPDRLKQFSRAYAIRLLVLERAVSISKQQTNGVVLGIGHGQVELAVSVEISSSQPVWNIPRGERSLTLEGPVPVAQKQTD